jgi:hypothetical protein
MDNISDVDASSFEKRVPNSDKLTLSRMAGSCSEKQRPRAEKRK